MSPEPCTVPLIDYHWIPRAAAQGNVVDAANEVVEARSPRVVRGMLLDVVTAIAIAAMADQLDRTDLTARARLESMAPWHAAELAWRLIGPTITDRKDPVR